MNIHVHYAIINIVEYYFTTEADLFKNEITINAFINQS